MFRVKHIDLVSCLHLQQLVLFHPLLVVLDAFLKPLGFFLFAILSLAVDKNLDCTVYDFRLLQDPLPDVFAAVRAFLFPDQTFVDAFLTERMAADRSLAADDVVHAN